MKVSVSKLKMVVSLVMLTTWMFFLVPFFVLGTALKIPGAQNLALWFHRGVLLCFNIECVTEGEVVTSRPTLYISNHISYIDIFVLGSRVPGTYIAKIEVASWPLFGTLAKLQKTLFVERRSSKVSGQIEQMQQHLLNKSNLILFPEGTSATGTHVAPFHTSFFQAAADDESKITIQPITVSYTHYKHQRMDREARDFYAWYKPRKILPHFLNGLGIGRGTANLTFHKPVKFIDFESRKACSKHCETVIRQGLLDALDLEEEMIL
jgi:1-acyl-sn-glycerol-3-phosphate acyltransferase